MSATTKTKIPKALLVAQSYRDFFGLIDKTKVAMRNGTDTTEMHQENQRALNTLKASLERLPVISIDNFEDGFIPEKYIYDSGKWSPAANCKVARDGSLEWEYTSKGRRKTVGRSPHLKWANIGKNNKPVIAINYNDMLKPLVITNKANDTEPTSVVPTTSL